MTENDVSAVVGLVPQTFVPDAVTVGSVVAALLSSRVMSLCRREAGAVDRLRER